MQCSHRLLTELCTFMPLVCCWILGCRALAAVVATVLPIVLGLMVARVMTCDMARTGCCRVLGRSIMLALVAAAPAVVADLHEW